MVTSHTKVYGDAPVGSAIAHQREAARHNDVSIPVSLDRGSDTIVVAAWTE